MKQKDGLTFQDYARLVTENLPTVNVTEEELNALDVERDLREWKKVVIFYSLRLFLAPLLESIILYDRMLWILEGGEDIHCRLIPTFDPFLSPRNHVMIADRGPLKK